MGTVRPLACFPVSALQTDLLEFASPSACVLSLKSKCFSPPHMHFQVFVII